jgi:hypothetical protein
MSYSIKRTLDTLQNFKQGFKNSLNNETDWEKYRILVSAGNAWKKTWN